MELWASRIRKRSGRFLSQFSQRRSQASSQHDWQSSLLGMSKPLTSNANLVFWVDISDTAYRIAIALDVAQQEGEEAEPRMLDHSKIQS